MGNIGNVTVKVSVDDSDKDRKGEIASRNVKNIDDRMRKGERKAKTGGGLGGKIGSRLKGLGKRLTGPLTIGAMVGAALTVGRLVPSENTRGIITGIDKAITSIKAPIQAFQMIGAAQITRDPAFFRQVTTILREDDQNRKVLENEVLGTTSDSLIAEGVEGGQKALTSLSDELLAVFRETIMDIMQQAAPGIVGFLWDDIKLRVRGEFGLREGEEISDKVQQSLDRQAQSAPGGNR